MLLLFFRKGAQQEGQRQSCTILAPGCTVQRYRDRCKDHASLRRPSAAVDLEASSDCRLQNQLLIGARLDFEGRGNSWRRSRPGVGKDCGQSHFRDCHERSFEGKRIDPVAAKVQELVFAPDYAQRAGL
jgi:hypothetical protein